MKLFMQTLAFAAVASAKYGLTAKTFMGVKAPDQGEADPAAHMHYGDDDFETDDLNLNKVLDDDDEPDSTVYPGEDLEEEAENDDMTDFDSDDDDEESPEKAAAIEEDEVVHRIPTPHDEEDDDDGQDGLM